MSNIEPPIEDPSQNTEPDHIKDLREKAKKVGAVESENAELKRKLAFSEAGIPRLEDLDPEDDSRALIGMFIRSYDGELTAEAIRADAAQIGILDRVAVSGERTPTADELNANQLHREFGGGQTPIPPAQQEGPTPSLRLLQEFHAAINSGVAVETAQMDYAAGLIHASATDDRVFFDQKAHDAEADAYDASSR